MLSEEQLEQYIDRFHRRMKHFMAEGLCEDGAYTLAEQMWERDADPQDDRRVCFECRNYIGKLCIKMLDRKGLPQMPLRFVLQRCDWFDLKGKK
jgi:hypothetical protein